MVGRRSCTALPCRFRSIADSHSDGSRTVIPISGNANETDMLIRNSTTGAFDIYDISHNAITTPAIPIGQVGLEWTVAGFGDFSSNPNETDMLMRRSSDGEFQVFDISNNSVTGSALIGHVGMEWTVAGIAADPPTGSSPAAMAQLVQAMAAFPSDGAAIDQSPINQATQEGTSQPGHFSAPSLHHTV